MPDAHSYVQALVDGLSTGSGYALVAMSFSALWASIRSVNMALLQVGSVAAVTTYALGSAGDAAAVVGGVLVAVIVGLGTHLISVRPFLSRGHITPIISSFGAGLAVQGILVLCIGVNNVSLSNVLPSGVFQVGGYFLRSASAIDLAVAAGVAIVALGIVRLTSIGLAFRAVSRSPDIALANGINVERVRLGSAAVASGLVGLTGILIGATASSAGPYDATAQALGLTGLLAMLLGGAGNLAASVLAGLFVGVLDSGTQLFISSDLNTVVSLGLLLVVLVIRPNGLGREA
jgi:branched-chain amino acid transport system permease protein